MTMEDSNAKPSDAQPRHREFDVDRGALVGAAISVGMFVVFQAMIVGAFQSGVIRGDTPLLAPLKFSGMTQAIYVFPTMVFFVNRRCPEMAKGLVAVAAMVLVGSVVSLVM